ncbi:MAG: hypothetical protein P1U57_11685 [Oleibacter sp.]|nr:hypothetical protein [Thalassolituus sp.]
MNINMTVVCDDCGTTTNCRVGMSNRRVQPLRFVCEECLSPIDINVNIGQGITVAGANQIKSKGPFDATTPFVDLHLDFPVSFEKYVMGQTPFMRATQRCGHENMQIHAFRVNTLNHISESSAEIKKIIKLYRNGKEKLYRKRVLSFLEADMDCKKKIDQNYALYHLLERCFSPFNEPRKNLETVEAYTEKIIFFAENKKDEFECFLKAVVDSNFLKNLQDDCLQIYPKILDFELILRPALFLDFDDTYENSRVAYRVSSHDFEEIKDLYKDISEVLSRQLVLIAGVNNLEKRGDHNKFAEFDKIKSPSSLNKFADVPFGQKLDLIDTPWHSIDKKVADNQLRNSIAHFKVEYDELSQQLTYFPRKEGIKQEKSEKMYFLDFSRKILLAYREMHKLNHLIKCLYVFYYLYTEPE